MTTPDDKTLDDLVRKLNDIAKCVSCRNHVPVEHIEAAITAIAALRAERDALRQLLLEARDWFHPRDSKVPGALVDMCDRIDTALKEGKPWPKTR